MPRPKEPWSEKSVTNQVMDLIGHNMVTDLGPNPS
jgi:hypothetical protein